MDRNTMLVALTGQLCGLVLIVTIVTSVVRYRRGSVARPPSDGLQRIEARLAEMQDALDAVAVEVERIAEGQRFTAKLLAEKGALVLDAATDAHAAHGAASSR